MSENLRKCFGKLQAIAAIKSTRERIRTLKKIGDDCLFLALKEIIVNLLHRNIKLTKKERRSLRRHKKVILTIAKKKHRKRHKKLLSQSGGFLPILIPAVAALLGSILT